MIYSELDSEEKGTSFGLWYLGELADTSIVDPTY